MESWSVSSSAKSSANRPSVLSSDFFKRHTVEVAKDLLGKILEVRDSEGEPVRARIVETEAYREDDPASHASRGKTPRNEPMFGPPGFAYVYFIYGMYEMLNFVTEPAGKPGAVLIRAVEPLSGIDRVRSRRKVPRRDWTSGPGRLTRALAIRMDHNRESLSGNRLSVLEDSFSVGEIMVSPRVGISQGVEKPWRFYISGHPDVSRASQNKLAVPL